MGAKDDIVRLLFADPDVCYCGPCLSSKLGTPLRDLDWADLVADSRIAVAQAPCAECLSVRTVIRGKVLPKPSS
jgi:hypothetical protein